MVGVIGFEPTLSTLSNCEGSITIKGTDGLALWIKVIGFIDRKNDKEMALVVQWNPALRDLLEPFRATKQE